jgi:hypothetical protein
MFRGEEQLLVYCSSRERKNSPNDLAVEFEQPA